MADDLARRRELRRRKILENSENRLRKLLGENARVNREGESVNSADNMSTTRAAFPDKTTIKKAISQVIETKLTDVEILEESYRDDSSPPALSSRHLLRNLTDDFSIGDVTPRSDQFPTESVTTKNYNLSEQPNERTTFMPKSDVDQSSNRKVTGENISQKTSIFSIVRRIIIIAIAIVLYFTAYFDLLQFVFGKSIIVPFILTEIGMTTYEFFYVSIPKPMSLNTVHSLLNGALILSGVPEVFISRIAIAFFHCARYLEDVSISLFTFFVLHWFVQLCTT